MSPIHRDHGQLLLSATTPRGQQYLCLMPLTCSFSPSVWNLPQEILSRALATYSLYPGDEVQWQDKKKLWVQHSASSHCACLTRSTWVMALTPGQHSFSLISTSIFAPAAVGQTTTVRRSMRKLASILTYCFSEHDSIPFLFMLAWTVQNSNCFLVCWLSLWQFQIPKWRHYLSLFNAEVLWKQAN